MLLNKFGFVLEVFSGRLWFTVAELLMWSKFNNTNFDHISLLISFTWPSFLRDNCGKEYEYNCLCKS